MQPKADSGKGGLPITKTIERGLPLDEQNSIILDTSSFGRPQVEIKQLLTIPTVITRDQQLILPFTHLQTKLSGIKLIAFNGDRWTGYGRDNALRYIMLENSPDGLSDETCDLILSASE